MIRAGLKGLAARRLRSALTALAIVLGVGMVSAALLTGATMKKGADSLSAAAYDGTGAAIVADAPGGGDYGQTPTVPRSLVARVSGLPEVGRISGDVTDLQTKLIGRDGKPIGTGPYFGVGVDAERSGGELDPFELTSGAYPHGMRQVLVDAGTAADQGWHVGDRIEVAARGPVREMEISGLARFGQVESIGTGTIAVFDLSAAQKLLGRGSSYDSILAAPASGYSDTQLRAALSKALPGDVRVESASEADRFTLGELETAVHFIAVALLVFGGIAVLVGAFTIFNALSITIAQRTRELALMRSMGASRRQVMGSVLTEALVLSSIASAIGVAAGYAIAKGLISVMASVGMDLPRVPTTLSPAAVAVALAVGIGSTVVAALIPARRAMRIAPVEAMRAQAVSVRKPKRMARVIRLIASVLGRPAERFGGSAGLLARRNAMRNPGRTAASAAALAIGLAVVVAIAVIGHGLQSSATSSLEQRIGSDYVLASSDGFSPVDPRAATELASQPGVSSVSQVTQDQAAAFGAKVDVNGVDPATIADSFVFDLGAGSAGAVSKLDEGGAIVASGFAEKHHLQVGDPLRLQTPRAGTVDLEVAGIDSPPKINAMALGDVTVSDQVFGRAFTKGLDRMALIDVAGGPSPAAQRTLTAALGSYPGLEAQTASTFASEQTKWIEDVLSLIYVLLVLSIVVSLFGIVNTMALVVFERTREVGMLRASGMSRRQLRRMIRHESVITALIGAVMGMIAGLAIAGVVTAAFSSAGLGFSVPVGSMVAFAILAALAGVLAGALPARRAARLDPLVALQYE